MLEVKDIAGERGVRSLISQIRARPGLASRVIVMCGTVACCPL
eukprot:COSAG01_NODE_5558_length_4185_cov_3.756241_2_plen_43_part_00